MLQRMLDRHGDYEVINAAVPASTSSIALKIFRTKMLPLDVDTIVICVGANDITEGVILDKGNTVVDKLKRNLRPIVDLARNAGVRIILTVPPLTSFFPFAAPDQICQAVREVATERKVTLVDLQRAFEAEEQREGLILVSDDDEQSLVRTRAGKRSAILTVSVNPNRLQHVDERIYAVLDRGEFKQRLAVDGCHPNPEGHQSSDRIREKKLVPRSPSMTHIPANVTFTFMKSTGYAS